MEVLGYIAAIFIGLILGILGGGGSILTIPILVYLFQIDAVIATGYSLFIVGVTSLVGAVPKYKEHLVDTRAGLLFGLPSVISIFATRKWFIPFLPDIILQTDGIIVTKRALLLGTFALLMILASITMIRRPRVRTYEPSGSKSIMIFGQGIVLGFLTGLVGAGGGFLIIPALVVLTGLSFKTAVGTSLFIIGINSLIGFTGDILNYHMDWAFLLLVTTTAVAGILVGTKLSRKIAANKLRNVFGWFVLIMGSWMLLNEIFFHF